MLSTKTQNDYDKVKQRCVLGEVLKEDSLWNGKNKATNCLIYDRADVYQL